jgi:hypothetical protein
MMNVPNAGGSNNAIARRWRGLSATTRNWVERVVWTFVQAFVAVVVVVPSEEWTKPRSVIVGAVAAGISAIKVLVQQQLASNATRGIVIHDPEAPGMSQTELQEATPDAPVHTNPLAEENR